MNKPTLHILTQRLDRLEREIRWWKILGTAAVAVLALALLLGATGEKVAEEIRAKRFWVVDEDGKRRAGMSINPDGTVGLAITDKNGKARIGLGVSPEGFPALALQDKDESMGLSLFQSPLSGTVLRLYDTARRLRAQLGVEANGTPTLIFYDQAGKSRTVSGKERAVTPGRTWVLWKQFVLPDTTAEGMEFDLFTVALGAWPTRKECESERVHRQPAMPPTAGGLSSFSCLPDNVDPRQR